MADDYAEESRECHPKRDKQHGKQAGLANTLFSAEPYSHGAAGCNHSSRGMMEPQPYAKADSDGQNKDEVCSKCLILPIEDVTVGEVLAGPQLRRIAGWLL